MGAESSHQDKIRERFTATADVFAKTVRSVRVQEAERLAERAAAGLANADKLLAIDVACGPGTFTRPLARRVGRAIGADLTPAMVEKARAEAARDGITNIEFVCADVYSLPFSDGAAGIVSCGYAFHHMTDPARALAEMARVLQRGGRLAITDIIVPEGCGAEIQNAIERERDPSHTTTQSVANFRAMVESAGLRVLSENLHENWHDFDVWMRNAGKPPGDPVYVKTRSMMENCIGDDSGEKTGRAPSGFYPRRSDKIAGGLEFMHTVLLLIAEKPE
ncbi:MAG TPA: class I SAM-dependent methyltransferase [Candidatus Acidoferrales bacterium]|nr:class I SAM-dependent methyltransferase [Candidatus Acidoferrales bacterium]